MDGTVLHAAGLLDSSLVAEIAEYAAEVDCAGTFPWDGLNTLQAAGLLALTARKCDGGQDASLTEVADLVRLVGRGCASTG